MPTQPHFRDSLLAAKRRLIEGREKLRAQHDRGSLGVQLCARQADLLDTVLLDLFEAALRDLNIESLRDTIALVPHGGYGRRDVAPFSDLDLMVLDAGKGRSQVAELVTRLMQDLYDVGLYPGNSVRTPSEAVGLARDDASIYTSLIESRFLAGSQKLFEKFRGQFVRMTERRYRALYDAVVEARRKERVQYGETVYLLRPNIKRSHGTLREIQLLRWIGFARFGAADPDRLQLMGALSKEDRRILQNAREFLLRTRNEMHFHAGKSEDVLDRDEQVRMAGVFGYRGRDGILPVEAFMQDYFLHTSRVRHLVSRFVNSVKPANAIVQALGPVFSHQVEGDFRVGPNQISATRQGLVKLTSSLSEVLRLADLANLYDTRIDHATWEAVCRAAPSYDSEISDDVAARFLSILSQPARLGEVLRRLHELGVLEKIIPSFKHARGLLQFNEYHQFTVDEHCFRAVEAAADLAAEHGPLGDVYRVLKQKRTLHLALLIHDLGKGYAEDHSDVGLRLAADVAERLRLPASESDQLKFLVHKHLVMSHLAFRRDTSDEQLIIRFAVEVGSPEVLKMLYVMTCADLAAVGPGVLNSWKIELLSDLYRRTLRHLTAETPVDISRWLGEARQQVWMHFDERERDPWCEAHVEVLPASYLQSHAPQETAAMLRRLRQLEAGAADAWGCYLPESRTVEFTVIVDHGHGRGVFAKLTGALSSQGLEILSADINSLAGEAILDRFLVHDPDYDGTPPQERMEHVCRALIESIDREAAPRFRKLWGSGRNHAAGTLSPLSTRVYTDNGTSQQYTIIDVFTFDRVALLYTIAKTLVEMRLSVYVAKIGTYLDQVVDVFYVTDENGKKIEDESRLESIRQGLIAAIDT